MKNLFVAVLTLAFSLYSKGDVGLNISMCTSQIVSTTSDCPYDPAIPNCCYKDKGTTVGTPGWNVLAGGELRVGPQSTSLSWGSSVLHQAATPADAYTQITINYIGPGTSKASAQTLTVTMVHTQSSWASIVNHSTVANLDITNCTGTSTAGGGDCPEPPPGGGWWLSKTGPETPTVMDDCSDLPGGSPLVIDLGQDNFTFGGPENPVLFDLLGYGQPPLLLQWVSPDGNDVFLINDINGNGVVDNGSELFGAGTRLLLELDEYNENPLALNGYTGLQQYDNPLLGGNNDGFITEDDSIWSELFVWLDQNADGISTEGEIISMYAVGLTRLDISPKESRNHDHHGNALIFWSWTYDDDMQGHNKFKMVDVFFKILSD